jgi:Tfp pilus assembly protein PilV
MCTHSHSSRRPVRRGFTLIEAAIVTVIVGIGIVAMLELMAAGTMANTESTEVTTAMALANSIHERAMSIPYTDLLTTLDNRTFSPPIDANNNSISGLSTWNQQVDVSYVDPNRITFSVPDTQVEPTARLTVTVNHNQRIVYQMTWLSAASEWNLPY